MPTPPGASRPFFLSLIWRVRSTEIREAAMRRLQRDGVQAPTPRQIETATRAIIKDRLRPAFDDPSLNALSQEERDGYRRAFEQTGEHADTWLDLD